MSRKLWIQDDELPCFPVAPEEVKRALPSRVVPAAGAGRDDLGDDFGDLVVPEQITRSNRSGIRKRVK